MQASNLWPAITATISKAWPPNVYDDPQRDTNLLEDVLLGKAHVWVGLRDKKDVLAIAVTNFVVDYYSKQQSLQIIAFAGISEVPLRFYATVLPTLKAFAVCNKCLKIIGYVTNEKLIRLYKRLGAKTDTHFVELDTLTGLEGQD